jgi:AcrR family transcriptional regulator
MRQAGRRQSSRQARTKALIQHSAASGARTRSAILDAAEKLFAAFGFDGTSIRDVAQAADVPLALVSYHFKSKLGLYRSVFQRRLVAIDQIRTSTIDQIGSGDDPMDLLRQVSRALVEPIIQLNTSVEGSDFARLIAREVNDPQEAERGIIKEHFDPIAETIIAKLLAAFPEVDKRSIYWSYLFGAGALAINHVSTGRIERLSKRACRSSDASAILDNLVEFIAGGMLANFQKHSVAHRRGSR